MRTASALIPLPVSVSYGTGQWPLPAEMRVTIASEFESALAATNILLSRAGDLALKTVFEVDEAHLRIRWDAAYIDEAYTLEISESGIDISAASDSGVFYALQTLRQLLPATTYAANAPIIGLPLPFVVIEDKPRFAWRGMHLDVCRHFMPVEFIKRFIDLLALHKMNRFHWHLSEDQGWRLEIKKYPRLTEIGSVRAQTVVASSLFKLKSKLQYDGAEHGGFYTQEEVRSVVAYAHERHITVVPEIEFPGHAQAAIAAYPELGNTGKQLKVKEEWGISNNTFKPSDETLEFYRNVLAEVMELFPSKYIHIGGDEAPKKQWQHSEFAQQRIEDLGLEDEKALQSWLILQVRDYLNENGRTLLGWDEIMQGGLVDNSGNKSTVMAWRGQARGEAAVRAGHDVVMAPTSHTYFDYYQADKSIEPLAIGLCISLETVYAFEPIPQGLSESLQHHVLGGQGQLWTEFMKTPAHVEYMAFPRTVALSEALWSQKSAKDFSQFHERLSKHLQRLTVLSVNYRPLGNDQLRAVNRFKNWSIGKLIMVYHWYTDL